MDAIGARAETGAVIASGALDRLARTPWLRAQRCVLFGACRMIPSWIEIQKSAGANLAMN